MPYLTVWTRPWLEVALQAAEGTDLRPGLALTAREALALPDPLHQRVVALVRRRRAEVVSRGYACLPPDAPGEAWRMNLSLGQQAFWARLGRMPTAAFGIPFPALLLEAHLEVALRQGPSPGVFLWEDGPGLPALEVGPQWPETLPPGGRRDPEAVVGILDSPRPDLDRWVERHGPGLAPSDLARYEPRRRLPAPAPPGGPVPAAGSRGEWERLLASLDRCPPE